MLVIRNIGQLVLPTDDVGPVPNTTDVKTLENAYISVDKGKIVAVGSDADCVVLEWFDVIDAGGGCVVPGLIDSHTHCVYAGSREREFVRRIQGKSYAEIAEEGGGIKASVEFVRSASLEGLVELALPRLRRMLANGVTTIEVKSGYGLNVDDELKMLRAVKRLNELQPVELIPTYLAAHTIPAEYADRRSEYVDLVCSDELLGRVAHEHLAEFADVFCERTAFTLEESRRILLACKERGLIPTIHADQITQIGASRLAAEVEAVSADHLETIDDEAIEAMKKAGVVATLLPGCSFFLGVEQAPARKIVDAGLPVALATDYNPGSAMVESLPLVMSIACTQMRMTPAECVLAVTVNAAAAVNRRNRLGLIKKDHQADLTILDVPNYDRWLYEVGRNCVRTVIKNGEIVHKRST